MILVKTGPQPAHGLTLPVSSNSSFNEITSEDPPSKLGGSLHNLVSFLVSSSPAVPSQCSASLVVSASTGADEEGEAVRGSPIANAAASVIQSRHEAQVAQSVKTIASGGTASDTATLTPTVFDSGSTPHVVPIISSPTTTTNVVSVSLSKTAQKKLRKQQAAAAIPSTETLSVGSAQKAMETVSAALRIASTSGESSSAVEVAAAVAMPSMNAPHTTVLDNASARSVDRATDAESGALNVARASVNRLELSATPRLVALPIAVPVPAPLRANAPTLLVPASLPMREKEVVITRPPLSNLRKEINRLTMSRNGLKKSLIEAERSLSQATKPKVIKEWRAKVIERTGRLERAEAALKAATTTIPVAVSSTIPSNASRPIIPNSSTSANPVSMGRSWGAPMRSPTAASDRHMASIPDITSATAFSPSDAENLRKLTSSRDLLKQRRDELESFLCYAPKLESIHMWSAMVEENAEDLAKAEAALNAAILATSSRTLPRSPADQRKLDVLHATCGRLTQDLGEVEAKLRRATNPTKVAQWTLTVTQLSATLAVVRDALQAELVAIRSTEPPAQTSVSQTEPSKALTSLAPAQGPARRSLEGLKEALERKERAEGELVQCQCRLRDHLADAANPAILVDSSRITHLESLVAKAVEEPGRAEHALKPLECQALGSQLVNAIPNHDIQLTPSDDHILEYSPPATGPKSTGELAVFRADWRGGSGTLVVASSPAPDKIEAATDSQFSPTFSQSPALLSHVTMADRVPSPSSTAGDDVSGLIKSRDRLKRRIAQIELDLTNPCTEELRTKWHRKLGKRRAKLANLEFELALSGITPPVVSKSHAAASSSSSGASA